MIRGLGLSVMLFRFVGIANGPEFLSELDDYFANALLGNSRSDDELMFPSLSPEQLKFGVNPSYPEFTAPVFGDPDAGTATEVRDSVNDEIAEDPFQSSDQYVPPKKASLKALLGQDPRVLATAIEDERINDIYFTSKN